MTFGRFAVSAPELPESTRAGGGRYFRYRFPDTPLTDVRQWRTIYMVFVETSLFTGQLPRFLGDDEYRSLQSHLMAHPGAGVVIKGSGGVRKVRWRSGGRGKSGGVRVIYYWAMADEQIFMLTLYGKGEKENLSVQDLRKVSKLVEEMTNG